MDDQQLLFITDQVENLVNRHLKKIRSEVNSRATIRSKLSFLIKEQLQIERSVLYPVEIFSYQLKANLVMAVGGDRLSKHLLSDDLTNDFKNFKVYWKKHYTDVLELKKSLNPASFVKKNEGLIPLELENLIIKNNSYDPNAVSIEDITSSILSEIKLHGLLENEIDNLINESGILTSEELADYISSFDGKINWEGQLNEFAFLFQRLIDASWIKQSDHNSANRKAILFSAHFNLRSRKNLSSAILRSVKDAFTNNAPLDPVLKEKFKIQRKPRK